MRDLLFCRYFSQVELFDVMEFFAEKNTTERLELFIFLCNLLFFVDDLVVVAEEQSTDYNDENNEKTNTDTEEFVDPAEAPSALALILGITIALAAIIFAGLMATFCVRRNGPFRQGHQTLTSFENPIYDCENVLK